MQETSNSGCKHYSDRFDGTKRGVGQSDGVPSEERELAVLRFMDRHAIPLPPKAIYRGLKIEDRITFSYRTVQNILRRLLDDNQVMRCDKDALDEGRVEEMPDDATGRRTYYAMTDRGKERLAGELDDDDAE